MYYVYELKYPESNIAFYVGKGKGRRAAYHTMRNKKGCWTENRYKDNVIRQILDTGNEPIIEYVFYSDNEDTAYAFEEYLIKRYGRRLFEENGILTNICESSRPPYSIYSEERKEKYRLRMFGNKLASGRKQTKEEKERRGNTLAESYKTGKRVVTQKMKDTSSITHTGKINSRETRDKISNAQRGIKDGPRSEEVKLRMKIQRNNNPPPNRKSIIINGVTYQSIRAAAREFKISEYKVKMLSDENSK